MTDLPGDAPAPERLAAAVDAIWVRYRDLMFQRLESVESAVDAIAAGALDQPIRETAKRDAHKLAGALGTFGLEEGTVHARLIENALAQDDTVALDVASLRDAARALRTALESKP